MFGQAQIKHRNLKKSHRWETLNPVIGCLYEKRDCELNGMKHNAFCMRSINSSAEENKTFDLPLAEAIH